MLGRERPEMASSLLRARDAKRLLPGELKGNKGVWLYRCTYQANAYRAFAEQIMKPYLKLVSLQVFVVSSRMLTTDRHTNCT